MGLLIERSIFGDIDKIDKINGQMNANFNHFRIFSLSTESQAVTRWQPTLATVLELQFAVPPDILLT